MKKGPYFENQEPHACGCFYPDSTRLGDDGKGNRLMFCLSHGFSLFKIRRNKLNPKHPRLRLTKLPTEMWRNKERKRMRSVNI